MYGPKIFRSQCSRKLKKSLKNYCILQFSSNLLQVFRKCSLHYTKECYVGILLIKKKFLEQKKKKFLLNFFHSYITFFCYCIKIRLSKFEEDCFKNVGGDIFLMK